MTLINKILTGPFFLDGAMGTQLQARGLKSGEAPEQWNLTHPEEITAIHARYYEAGSQMVLANTFGVNPLRYDEDLCTQMILAAVACARKARDAQPGGEDKYIALDIGPCGRLLKPFGDLDMEEAIRAFSFLARLGEKAGVDALMIETMTDSYETKAALLAARESSSLPVIVSNTYQADGRLMTGGTPESVTAMLEGLHADAVGVNCSLGPDVLSPIVERYLNCASVPVLMKPNAGMPVMENGHVLYPVGPQAFARAVTPLISKGLRILGGCCGTTPDHIRALRQAAAGLVPPPIEEKTATVVSSRGTRLTLGDTPLVIGERLNPTGKKRLAQALREGDMPYLVRMALEQEEQGAQALDINTGAQGVDEQQALPLAVQEIQAVCDLPLQLDTASPEAMEKALRLYHGKPLINSVNGRRDVMDRLFPLAKKYGGVLVALTLDEKGIPDTAEGRLAIAQNILAEAEKAGIHRRDIIFDPLTLAESAAPGACATTLKALQLIRDKTGCATILGVSNISFGLPRRDVMTASFLTMALHSGLSCAIMNPISDAVMGAMRAFRALNGQDSACRDYISFAQNAAEQPREKDLTGQAADLKFLIRKGLKAEAQAAASDALSKGRDGMSLIQEEIIPALNEVGIGFENKTLYLPQLLMSAEAAEAAFTAIRQRMANPAAQDNRCEVILATVQGDVHDIGKNIVRLLMENYGYRVTDLGKDVSPERVLEAVLARHAPLLGLSALMTTTVPAMAETIALVHEKAPFCRIIVGGAVLTEKWAREIGADGYAADAMATVRLAEKLA